MIPLRDSRRRRRFAWATWAIAAACVAVFVVEARAGKELPALVARWALVPAHVTSALHDPAGAARACGTVVTSLFLHASLVHLGGNLLFLVVFGDDLEERLGALRFVAFYLASGVVAAAAQIAIAPRSTAPLVGASGAIAGVLGAFLVLFPRAEIHGVLPLGCLLVPARTRAFLFLPLWFLVQLVAGFHALGPMKATGAGGVAWFAHLGGFAAGPPLYLLFRRR